MKTLISTIFAAILMGYGEPDIKMQPMTYKVRNISVSINKPAKSVYEFASNPENFPKWVQFVKSITRQDDSWIAQTDLGTIKIKFTPQNEFGIIDHRVTLANGDVVYNPMRVIANNEGCEFVFTLFWMPGRSETEFNEDAAAVKNDLHKLKEIMEGK